MDISETLKFWALVGGLPVAAIGLAVNAYATLRTVSSRRLTNYQDLIKSHRDLWKLTLETPNPFERVLLANPDLNERPITYPERRFVNLLLLHVTTAFAFSKKNDIVAIEQLKADVGDVFALPIPRAVWLEAKHYFNKDFVKFVEAACSGPQSDMGDASPHTQRWTILVLSARRELILDTLAQYGDRLMFRAAHEPVPTLRFIKECGISCVVCFCYPRKLPADVVASVPCINVHPGYLPKDRGPNPHLWSVLNRSTRGATVHYMDASLDTGDIIAQRELPLPDDATSFLQSFEQLMLDCAALLSQTWPLIRAGTNAREPQTGTVTSHTFRDQALLSALWNDDDLALPLESFRIKAFKLLRATPSITIESTTILDVGDVQRQPEAV